MQKRPAVRFASFAAAGNAAMPPVDRWHGIASALVALSSGCGGCGCEPCAAESREASLDVAWVLGVVAAGRERSLGIFWQGAMLYESLADRTTGQAAAVRSQIGRALVETGRSPMVM
jgi:hypothetical protein